MVNTINRELILKFAEDLGVDPTQMIEAVISRDVIQVTLYHRVDGVIQSDENGTPLLVRKGIAVTD